MIKEIKTSNILQRAKAKVEKKIENKAVKLLEDLLIKRQSAQTVVDNIDEEILETEQKIKEGNIPLGDLDSYEYDDEDSNDD